MPPFVLAAFGSLGTVLAGMFMKLLTAKALPHLIVWFFQVGYKAYKILCKKSPDPDDGQWLPEAEKFIRMTAEWLEVDIADWKP